MIAIENVGVEAALVRLGHAVRVYAKQHGLETPDHLTDEDAKGAALVWIGSKALEVFRPAVAVAVIEDFRESLEKTVDERSDDR